MCALVLGALACISPSGRGAESAGTLQDFVVRTWNKTDGLPDDSVTALLQTSDGYLWIGTASGLVRFDGVKFTEIAGTAATNPKPVSITALCEDSGGRLWAGSQDQGLFCWNAGVMKQYHQDAGLLDEGITSLTADAEGRLWIGTRKGLNRWDTNGFTAFTKKDGLPDDVVSSVHAARSGAVWITTPGGMCRYAQGRIAPYHFPGSGQEQDPEFLGAYEDRRGNLWAFCATYIINLAEDKRINYFPGEKSASLRIWSLCEGRSGRLWIGVSGRGVFCFDGKDFQPVTLNSGRWPNDVRAICEDHEGNLWLGISEGGLIQLRPQSFVLLKGSKGLPSSAATCLMLDAAGRIHVGMESGGVFANLGDHFEKVPDASRILSQDAAASICAGPDDSLWIGTFGAGLGRIKDGRTALCTTANGLSDDCVLAVCTDTNGAVWAGTQSGALHRIVDGNIKRFTRTDGLTGAPITALLPAHEGGLWIGTANGDLLSTDSHFANITAIKLTPHLTGKPIAGLFEGANHSLWIGSAGGGLGYLDATGCASWDSQDGLPDDFVLGVTADTEGNLWLTTSKGLCRVPRISTGRPHETGALARTKLLFETQASSSQPLAFGWPRALRSPEGRLWFATGSGLIGIDTRSWQPEKPAPQVHIESVLLDNQPLNLTSAAPAGAAAPPLRLSGSFKSLELQFTALSFESPEKVRFRHRLDRFDSDWIETGPERRVRYGHLPSGNYEFHVTACNAEGIWNETGAVIAFIIPTPLWRSPLALALYGLFAAGAVAGTVRVVSHRRLRQSLARSEQQQAMERERVRIAQDMHDEIGSKLTKISFLSEMAKVEVNGNGELATKIDSIAGTSRELLQALDEMVWAVNPRNDTLEQLCAYLSQYAREYFNNTPLECHVDLQPHLPQLAMSAEVRHNLFLAFEESLNNVLKHSGAAKVEVGIRIESDTLKIVVNDDGRGFTVTKPNGNRDPGASEGNGLVNMQQRLQDVGGRFSIESRAGHGTTVTLTASINSAKLP